MDVLLEVSIAPGSRELNELVIIKQQLLGIGAVPDIIIQQQLELSGVETVPDIVNKAKNGRSTAFPIDWTSY